MDVKGIQILVPFTLLNRQSIENLPPADFFRYRSFYFEIWFRCREIAAGPGEYKISVAHSNTAKNLEEMLKPHFGVVGSSLMPLNNGTFTTFGSLNDPPTYDRNALRNFPIQPVEYDEQDSYRVVKTLRTCEKVALMDTKDNIVAITNYLNNIQKIAIFVYGEGDSFFTTFQGWTTSPVRGSYFEKRLKVFICSGIFTHWEARYKLWKPSKLLGHYGNWKGVKIEAESRLDFSSKVTTGFYVCGISLGISLVILIAEIWRYYYQFKYKYWIHGAICSAGIQMCRYLRCWLRKLRVFKCATIIYYTVWSQFVVDFFYC